MLTQRYTDALTLATELHAGQLRKGTQVPYISHLLAVSSLVFEAGGTEDEAIAALLHDAVEDQGGPRTRALIAERFGENVATIVDGCTDDAPLIGAEKQPWKRRKEDYIKHLRHEKSRSVLLVSAADKVHNSGAIVTDFDIYEDEVWDRFNASPEEILWYYESLLDAFDAAEERINRKLPEPDVGLMRLLHQLTINTEALMIAAGGPELEQLPEALAM